jgi:hypothetical protein
MHTRAIFILERKEGEIGKQRERQRKRVCECGSISERRILASVIKTDRWEKPTDRFLGKAVKDDHFLGNYFNGEVGWKRYIKIKYIFKNALGDNWCNDLSHILYICACTLIVARLK